MCDASIEWNWTRPIVSDCTIITKYALQVSNVVMDLGSRQYTRPMTQITEDGGVHRPAQRDVSIYYDSGECEVCAVCDKACSCSRSVHSRYSVRPAMWTREMPAVMPSTTIREAVVSSRFDDHNPFFMLSLLFNAWAVKRRHGFAEPPALLVLGEKIPQPIDHLWSALISGNRSAVRYSRDLPDRFLLRRGYFLTTEYGSPLTRELSTTNPPCLQPSGMIQEFFSEAAQVMAAKARVDPNQIVFIRRQNYVSAGKFRHIGRILLNEERIIKATADALPAYTVRGVLMETMSQRQQIETMQKSQVVIGMHGAGMVNVGFMHPGANRLVIEIFPRNKRRWGYRNLCHYMNMSYIDYREGQDQGSQGHKLIDVTRWVDFVKANIRPHDKPYYSTVGGFGASRTLFRRGASKYARG